MKSQCSKIKRRSSLESSAIISATWFTIVLLYCANIASARQTPTSIRRASRTLKSASIVSELSSSWGRSSWLSADKARSRSPRFWANLCAEKLLRPCYLWLRPSRSARYRTSRLSWSLILSRRHLTHRIWLHLRNSWRPSLWIQKATNFCRVDRPQAWTWARLYKLHLSSATSPSRRSMTLPATNPMT